MVQYIYDEPTYQTVWSQVPKDPDINLK